MSVYREILSAECAELGIDLNEEAIKRFEIYAEYLIEYNKNVNPGAVHQ